ncbi:MAG: prepilin-type N-terminal cleavage/methylation domain-containing protein [bacterium]|nr:prepilin-type N-terminal cleavage/methylation domain-containing protein [bacterium]
MRGFSLMELMVVIALFTIITGAALMNHARFGEGILATNLAYDVALSLREAQSYGISVRESTVGGAFNNGYGIHFKSDTFFVFFSDKNNNRKYDGTSLDGVCVQGGESECLAVYKLERGNSIASFCGVLTAAGSLDCRNFTSGDTSVSFLDIVFKRPYPDAFIRTDLNTQNEERYQSARVLLVSPKRRESRTVEVFQTGQIAIRHQ